MYLEGERFLRNGYGLDREAVVALRADGVDPGLMLQDFAESQKVDWPERLSMLVNLADPVDRMVVKATDLYLDRQTKIRLADDSANIGLRPWEEWWVSLGNQLTDLSQKEMLKRWLSDSMLPFDIIDNLDRARPGAKVIWQERLGLIAEGMLYSYPRYLASDLIGSYVTGLSTMVGVAIGGFGDNLAGIVTRKLNAEAERPFSRYWKQYRLLISEFELAFAGSKTSVNAAVNVNELMWGYYEEFNFRLSMLQRYTTTAGLAAGLGSALGIAYGPAIGLAGFGGVVGVGGAVMARLNKKLMEDMLSEAVDKQAALSAELNELAKKRGVWQGISHEVGVDQLIDELIGQYEGIDVKIDNYSEVVTRFAKAVITLSSIYVRNVSYAGIGVLVDQLWYMAARNSQRANTYRYRQGLRQQALDKIRAAFAQQEGDRGTLSRVDRVVDGQQEIRDRLSGKLDVWLRQVAIPTFQGKEGKVDRMRFEPGFRLKAGGIVPIIGDNFSGKTSLLKSLGGFWDVDPSITRVKIQRIDFNSLILPERARFFPMIGKQKGSDIFDLKAIVAGILYAYKDNRIFPDIEAKRLENWVNGRTDEEVEHRVMRYIQAEAPHLRIDSSWLTEQKHIPSGAEQAFLYLALYMSVNEPMVMLLDEAGGEMTDASFGILMDYLKRVDFGQKALMVVANVRKKDWLALPGVVGVVRTNERIAGQKVTLAEDHQWLAIERSRELVRAMQGGQVLSRQELLAIWRDYPELDSNLRWTMGNYVMNQMPDWVEEINAIKKNKDLRWQTSTELLHVLGRVAEGLQTDGLNLPTPWIVGITVALEAVERAKYDLVYIGEVIGKRKLPERKQVMVSLGLAFTAAYQRFLDLIDELGTPVQGKIGEIRLWFDSPGYMEWRLERFGTWHEWWHDKAFVQILVGLHEDHIYRGEVRRVILRHLCEAGTGERKKMIKEMKRSYGVRSNGVRSSFWNELAIHELADFET